MEQRLKEEIAALRETNVQLESEKIDLTEKLEVNSQNHNGYVQQMDSKLETLQVRKNLNRIPGTSS